MCGAAEIVQRGLQMVNDAWIKRIPPTALTQIYSDAEDQIGIRVAWSPFHNWNDVLRG